MNISSLYIEITNQCNLNCTSCYNCSGSQGNIKELSPQTLENIISIFSPYGLKRILLSGGEPTLHSDLATILTLIDKYPSISFGLVTNGTNTNPLLINHLNTRDNFTVQISLDGSSEEINAKTRGPGNFDKTISFAKAIQKQTPKPILKMVVSQRNLSDIKNFCILAHELNFLPELSFLQKSGNGVTSWQQQSLTPQQKYTVLHFLDTFSRKHNINTSYPLCTISCPYTKGMNNLSLKITAEGNIMPCQLLYDYRYVLNNIHVFNEDTFRSNLYSFSHLANKRSHIDFNCSKCIMTQVCQKGCLATAIMLHNDPFSDDGNCEYRKLQFLQNIQLFLQK